MTSAAAAPNARPGGVVGFMAETRVDAEGNVCVATLVSGAITVVSPDGQLIRRVKTPDIYTTNICFGGADMKTAYITLSGVGHLVAVPWPEAGLKLNFAA
jgi:gluconolactonase